MNDLKTSLFIAYKTIIRGNKSTTVLIIVILSISFLNLTFISGILGDISRAIELLTINTETSHIIISPQEAPVRKDFIENQSGLRSRIEELPGIVATARRYATEGIIAYDKEDKGNPRRLSLRMIGIDVEDDKKVLSISQHLVAGDYLNGLREDEIVLGADTAGGYGEPTGDDLGGVDVGDQVEVMYGNGVTRSYIVRGIYKVGFYSGYGLVSSREIESALSVNNEASQILVKVDLNRYTLDNYLAQIHSIAPNLKIRKYKDVLGSNVAIMAAFDGISAIVSMVIVIVGAITIFVLIYVNAINKRRQIGVLKAIGIKSRIIVYSYMFQSLFYTICGLIIGLGLVFLALNPLLTLHPLELPMGNIGLLLSPLRISLSIGCILFAAFMAGTIPSYRVARQDILKSIFGG